MSDEHPLLIDTGNPLDKLRQAQHVYRELLDADDELNIDELRASARADAEQHGRIVAELIDEIVETELPDEHDELQSVLVYEARIPIIKEHTT